MFNALFCEINANLSSKLRKINKSCMQRWWMATVRALICIWLSVPAILIASLASGLRGIVSTGDQFVKTGFITERDWTSSKGMELHAKWKQMFIIADGQESKAPENVPMILKLHDTSYKMDTCVLKDSSLYRPVWLGLELLVIRKMTLQT